MVTFTKLFVIRIVANKRSLLSSRLLIFSSEGCFLSAIAFRSDGEREKKAISEADLVIAVGARFSDRVALNPNKFASKAKIIQIDIDPSELGKNVDVDLALAGDASYILQAILPYVEKTEHKIWICLLYTSPSPRD